MSLSSDPNFPKDEANQKLNDYMDELISEYLSVGDPNLAARSLRTCLPKVYRIFKTMSTEILDCITDTTQKVWSLLPHGCRYMQIIKDPIDFSWLGKSSNAWNFQIHLGSSDEDSYYRTGDQERTCRSIA
ncbi:protein SET DOMAIN GROUP 41-like [Melia azedarach]|uniref:Protein SET DOMAIN GROUP 41-like n=1 Tax=Melia azedarach TaxID=155640 RepID=A0ACC1WPC0_MELAZ|nr:protein SET DOMAIN GROUP 41-like [Melia azedarach]